MASLVNRDSARWQSFEAALVIWRDERYDPRTGVEEAHAKDAKDQRDEGRLPVLVA